MRLTNEELLHHLHAVKGELAEERDSRIWRQRRLRRMDMMLDEIIDLLLNRFEDESYLQTLRRQGADVEVIDAAKEAIVKLRLDEANPYTSYDER